MKKLHFIPILMLWLAACETVVDIDLPETDPKLVLNSYLTPDSTIEVNLSQSKSILEGGSLEYVNNGEVLIETEDGVALRLSRGNKPGSYVVDTVPEVGTNYVIIASADGFGTVTSETSIPGLIEITSIDTGSSYQFGLRQKEIRISFIDPATTNYYDLKLFVEVRGPDPLGGDSVSFRQEIFYTYSNEDLLGSLSEASLLQDTPFNGNPYTIAISTEAYQIDSFQQVTDSIPQGFEVNLLAELRNVNEDYFLYETTLSRYQFSSNDPFSQPAQVHNNIMNGFGIFAAFSSSYGRMKLR